MYKGYILVEGGYDYVFDSYKVFVGRVHDYCVLVVFRHWFDFVAVIGGDNMNECEVCGYDCWNELPCVCDRDWETKTL